MHPRYETRGRESAVIPYLLAGLSVLGMGGCVPTSHHNTPVQHESIQQESVQNEPTHTSRAQHSAVLRQETLTPAVPVRAYRLEKVLLKDFAPRVSEELIELPEHLNMFVKVGHGYTHQYPVFVDDPVRFESVVYNEARKVGYAPEKLRSLSPKDTIEAVLRIVEHRFDYVGYPRFYRFEQRLDKLNDEATRLWRAIVDSSDTSPELKESAEKMKEAMQEIVVQSNDFRSPYFDLIAKNAFPATKHLDIRATDRVFEDTPEVRCVQFANAVQVVFDLLKKKNPQLTNVYVATVTSPNHRLNQAAAVFDRDGTVNLKLTYFDPTKVDCGSFIRQGSVSMEDAEANPSDLSDAGIESVIEDLQSQSDELVKEDNQNKNPKK